MPPLELPNLSLFMGNATFHALQSSCRAREPECFSIMEEEGAYWGRENPTEEATAFAIPQLILASFPMEKMLAYKEFKVFEQFASPWGESGIFAKLMTANSVVLIIAILTAVFSHASLVLSGAKSDEARMQFWSRFGMVIVLAGYLATIIGIIITQTLLVWVAYIRFPHYAVLGAIDAEVNYPIFIPLASLAVILPMVLCVATQLRFRKRGEVPKPNEARPDESSPTAILPLQS
eukprot:FR739399.1.p1 GENE.FR739399.1~~FR739399.1.p1  ORF type:complete len:242 (+),score=21.39 FR739399.1:25-726(+)